MADETLERFEITGNEQPPFTFAGMHITAHEDASHIDQYFYMNKIEQIPMDADFSKFASMRIKLAWRANSRLDLVLEISLNAQVTRAAYKQDISNNC